jgi:arylsulfatase A-like enzyme
MVKGWDPFENLPTITEKAVAWLQKQDEKTPFFLYFAFGSPHAPIIPNDKFLGKSGAGPFGDFVFETDAMAGRILQVLEEKDLADNTIVVFSADNGPEKYAFERYKKYGHWSPGKLRGLKRDVWEGGHRVPFIIRWPGKIKAGKVVDETISQVDLAATFANVIGYKLKSDQAIDSYNLVPLLKGKRYKEPLRVATVQNTHDRAFALRQGDWLFIDAKSGTHSKPPKGFEEAMGYTPDTTPGLLYNLKKDLSQHNNLYEQHPEKISAMKALLERYKAGEGCAPHAR